MQPYQLKQKKKLTVSARNSPHNTRSRRAAATINSTINTKEGDHTAIDGTTAPFTPEVIQVSEMSTKKPTSPLPDPDPNTRLSLEDMIGNLSAQFPTFDTTIKRIDDNLMATRAEMNSNQTTSNSQLQNMIEQNQVLEEKLSAANKRIIPLENLYFEMYHKQERDLMNKQAMNQIIRGIPESQNNVGSFAHVDTNGASRLGNNNQTRANDPTAPPRPIRLRCATVLQKGEVIRALDKLKKVDKFILSVSYIL